MLTEYLPTYTNVSIATRVQCVIFKCSNQCRGAFSLRRVLQYFRLKCDAYSISGTYPIIYVSVNSNWVHPPGNPRGLAQKNCPGGGGDLTFESCPGTGNSTGVIHTGCPKNFYKMGNTTLLISSSNYAKRHINVCSGG